MIILVDFFFTHFCFVYTFLSYWSLAYTFCFQLWGFGVFLGAFCICLFYVLEQGRSWTTWVGRWEGFGRGGEGKSECIIWKTHFNFKKKTEARDMAQWLRAPPALLEILSPQIPATTGRLITIYNGILCPKCVWKQRQWTHKHKINKSF